LGLLDGDTGVFGFDSVDSFTLDWHA
jgi:hypothetical protein